MLCMENKDYLISLSARLDIALDIAGIPERQKITTLAKWAEVSREAARKWLRSHGEMRKEHLISVASKLKCREEWLEYGRGSREVEVVNIPLGILALAQEFPDATEIECKAVANVLRAMRAR